LLKTACSSKDELITKLLKKIYDTNHNLPLLMEEVFDTIIKREKIGGTVFPTGLSVPHARLKNFDGFVIALATPAEALFHDGIQIRMMALMITSQSGGLYYLPALAALTKISRDSAYFGRLYSTENFADMIRIFGEQNMELA